MGLGFYLIGKADVGSSRQRQERWLESVVAAARRLAPDDFLRSHIGSDHEDLRQAEIALHPAAECLLVIVSDPDTVIFSAQTSAVGVGYHVFAANLVAAIGNELRIRWLPASEEHGTGDETEYFETRDIRTLEASMQTQIGAMLRVVVRELKPGSTIRLSMPSGLEYSRDEPILTQLGPRSMEWAQRGVRDPAQAMDIYPWRNVERDASYYLGKALVVMWLEIPWREPFDDAEAATLARVCNWLDRAFALDPSLDYPWHEWREVLEHSGRTSPHQIAIEHHCEVVASERIGYRRGDQWHDPFPHWRVRVPGSFYSSYEDDNTTWFSHDRSREVWLTSLSYSGHRKIGAKQAPASISAEHLQYSKGGVEYSAQIEAKVTDSGHAYYLLSGRAMIPGHDAILSVIFEEAHQKEWALDVWRSLTPVPRKPPDAV